MKYLTILLTVLMVNSLVAQPNENLRAEHKPTFPAITGKIVNEKNEPIPYASISLYNLLDSTLIKGTTSNSEGYFKIIVRPGKYYLEVRFLSFQSKIISDINHNKPGVKLGDIVLKADAKILEEVEVIGRRSEMVLSIDKRIFNVGTDLTNTGNNALEILENVPSVSVDIDGNVSLRGSENVRILVDGKESGLVGISSTDALRQLQGNIVKSVEVITNPSARYDAEGEVGIINIVLKKERQKGLNGSLELHTGIPHNHRVSFSLNYRKKKVNFFTSIGISYRESPGKGSAFQQYEGSDTSYLYQSTREHTRGGTSNNFRLGAEFFLNRFSTLTFSGLYRHSDGKNNAELVYKDFDENNLLTQTVSRNEDEDEMKQNIEFAVNYTKKFEKEGQKWTSDFKWIQGDDTEFSNIIEQSDNGSSPICQRINNTEDQLYFLVQTDYEQPLGENSKMETGLKATFREINNDYTVEEQAVDENWDILDDYDNHFIYNANIYAGYVIFNQKLKNFSFQLGLRGEFSDICTQLTKTDVTNDRSYFDLFPSVHFSYESGKNNTLQLSYARRLSRPRFRHLLPFFTFSDNRNFFSGNPDLDPEYTHSFEIGHLKNWEKGSLLSSLYYRYRTGVINRVLITDSTGFSQRFPINLSTQNAYGLELNFSYMPVQWWRINTNFNFYRAITDGEYKGQKLYSDTYSWRTRGSSKITIWKEVDFQTTFRYRGPRQTTQGESKASYAFDTGLSKDIFKGKGTLTFSVKDLFNTRKRRSITESENFFNRSEFQWRSRQFLLTLNYRINQKKKRERSNGRNESDSELNEMGF